MPESSQPIACSLDRDRYIRRLDEIATLRTTALQRVEHGDGVLVLWYAAAAAAAVRALVAEEATCCAFLRFDVIDAGDAVGVRIAAPEGARAALPDLFAAWTGA